MTETTNGISGNAKYTETTIPVPWGHISGKWWGDKMRQPLIAIHGWQDNAGSFDNLAPLLVERGHSLFCVDLPGHGLSSHFPAGQSYYIFWDGIHILRRIVRHFNWKNITVIGHSLGGGIAFLYAAVFPDDIVQYVSIDIASPSVRDPHKLIKTMGHCVDKMMKFECMTVEATPTYTYDELIDVILDGYGGSVTRNSCEILMKRGVATAPNQPGKYVFTRDPRLKVAAPGFMTRDQILAFAGQTRCAVLNIRGKQGLKLDYPELYNETLDAIEKVAKKVERHVVDGTHHLHLNNAETIVNWIHTFLVAS